MRDVDPVPRRPNAPDHFVEDLYVVLPVTVGHFTT